MKRYMSLLAVCLTLCFSAPAFAVDAQSYMNMPGPFYQDMGYMGMGGAGVATTNDANAVFYNPAGLADIQHWNAALLNVQVEGSKSLFQAASYAQGGNTASILQNEQQFNGNLMNVGASDYSYFAMQDFSVGLLANATLGAIPNVPSSSSSIGNNTNLGSIAARGDLGGVVGLADSFFGGNLDVGGSLFLMNQYYYANPMVTKGNTQNLSLSSVANGFGVMGNIGVIGHLVHDSLLDWTVGASEQSVGTASFGPAGYLPEETNVGTGVRVSPGFGTLTADVDYDDLMNQTGWGAQDHVFAGLRYDFPYILGLSAGVFEGNPTFGITLNFKLLKVQAAYWTIAPYMGIPADTVVGMQVALGWL